MRSCRCTGNTSLKSYAACAPSEPSGSAHTPTNYTLGSRCSGASTLGAIHDLLMSSLFLAPVNELAYSVCLTRGYVKRDGRAPSARVCASGHAASAPSSLPVLEGSFTFVFTLPARCAYISCACTYLRQDALVDLAGSPIDADRGLMLQLGVVPHDLHVDLDDSTRVPRRSIQIEQPDSQVDVRIHDRTVADRVLRDLHVAEDEVALEQPVADVDQLGLWHHNRYDAVDDGVLATACVGRTLELEITSQVVFTRR